MKQIFNIAKGKIENVQQVLLLKFGTNHGCFAICNKSGDELYRLAYCKTEEWDSNNLSEFATAFPELNNTFYSVQVSYDFPESTLAPLKDYRQEEYGSLLKALYGINGTSAIVTETIPEWQLYNVYAVPVELRQWINRYFPTASYRHQSSLATRQINRENSNVNLLVDFRTDDFTVTSVRQDKLLLSQYYPYSTPGDVVYYLLKICQQFSLSQQEVQLRLSGLIDKQSALYKELYQYFIKIDFRDASWNIPDSEYPNHFFTSLNDLAQCVS